MAPEDAHCCPHVVGCGCWWVHTLPSLLLPFSGSRTLFSCHPFCCCCICAGAGLPPPPCQWSHQPGCTNWTRLEGKARTAALHILPYALPLTTQLPLQKLQLGGAWSPGPLPARPALPFVLEEVARQGPAGRCGRVAPPLS